MLANCGVTDFRPDIAHFGTNRGTSGFNPVWTACDMIMKSKSELEALVLAHAAICSISTRMIDSSSALSHASRFSNSHARAGVSMPATQKHQIPTKRWPTDPATVEPEADTWKVNIINGNSKMILD